MYYCERRRKVKTGGGGGGGGGAGNETTNTPFIPFLGIFGNLCTLMKSYSVQLKLKLGIHIVQPRFANVRVCLRIFPKGYVPNPCILGTRTVLPFKNGYCCKLELIRAKSVLVLRYSCYLSAVGCSQVELSYQ